VVANVVAEVSRATGSITSSGMRQAQAAVDAAHGLRRGLQEGQPLQRPVRLTLRQ
jgi:hypothetical protein